MSTTEPRRRNRVGVLVASVIFAALPAPAPGGANETLWERAVSVQEPSLLSGTAVDLDLDGRDEVLLHSGRRNDPSCVVVLAGSTGEERWRADFPGRSCVVHASVAADAAPDVVVACGTDLSVLDGATGERLRGTTLRAPIGDLVCARIGVPVIVYTAGRKRDDVLVVLAGEDLRELWSRGAAPASGPFARGFTHASALDVDGDGRDEVVVAENGNRLLCVSGEGELLWDVGLGRRERLNPEGVVSSTPVVADLLGDGVNELAVGCFAGAVVVMDARTGEVLDRMQFGAESHEEHLSNSKIPRFIREALRQTGEPVNCLTPVELDGIPGEELVIGCSDGFVYAYDPAEAAVMWRFETRDNVYDPCLALDQRGPAAPARDRATSARGPTTPAPGTGAVRRVLVWDSEAVYLLDGRTGSELPGIGDTSGAAGLLLCDLDGTLGPELVHISPRGGRVAARSLEVVP